MVARVLVDKRPNGLTWAATERRGSITRGTAADTERGDLSSSSKATADKEGGGGAVPEFAVALSEGLIINSHDNYEIQEQVELSVLQEEIHAMCANNEALATRFGHETVKSILAEVGDQASEDMMHFGNKTPREQSP